MKSTSLAIALMEDKIDVK